ncbi:hypothetical protein JXA85_04340 [Candidatus Woesearchaeota archaeon]|nr:hypothetical protein [Candidatus Woesearchaeota archaeon]
MAKKGNKAKLIILGILVIALIIFAFNFNKIFPSKQSEVWVDPLIYEEFDKGNEWVAVVVHIENISLEDFVSSLKSDGIQDIVVSKLSSSFAAGITRAESERLRRNKYVTRIGFNAQASPPMSEEHREEPEEIGQEEAPPNITEVINVTCGDCQYAVNNTCYDYECCDDGDCDIEYKCEGNKCIINNCFIRAAEVFPEPKTIPFETLKIDNNYLSGIYKPRNGFGYAIITNSSYLEEITNSNSIEVNFTDFENYILILVYTEKTLNNYPEIYNITQIMQGVIIDFLEKGDYKDYPNNGWHIVKVNRMYITPREGLDFEFLEYEDSPDGRHLLGRDNIPSVHIAPPKDEYPTPCKEYKIYMNAPFHHYYNCTILETDYYCSNLSFRWPL